MANLTSSVPRRRTLIACSPAGPGTRVCSSALRMTPLDAGSAMADFSERDVVDEAYAVEKRGREPPSPAFLDIFDTKALGVESCARRFGSSRGGQHAVEMGSRLPRVRRQQQIARTHCQTRLLTHGRACHDFAGDKELFHQLFDCP